MNIAMMTIGSIGVSQTYNNDLMINYAAQLWAASTDSLRNWYQMTFICCGFTGPAVMPGSVCPATTSPVGGCYQYAAWAAQRTLLGISTTTIIFSCFGILITLYSFAAVRMASKAPRVDEYGIEEVYQSEQKPTQVNYAQPQY
jgi:hypothetical protein